MRGHRYAADHYDIPDDVWVDREPDDGTAFPEPAEWAPCPMGRGCGPGECWLLDVRP